MTMLPNFGRRLFQFCRVEVLQHVGRRDVASSAEGRATFTEKGAIERVGLSDVNGMSEFVEGDALIHALRGQPVRVLGDLVRNPGPLLGTETFALVGFGRFDFLALAVDAHSARVKNVGSRLNNAVRGHMFFLFVALIWAPRH